METKNYSEEIATSINAYLTEEKWNYHFDDEEGIFRFNVTLDTKIPNLKFRIEVDEEDYIVYAYMPNRVNPNDEKVMSRVSEFINRVNEYFMIGNFELNYYDGIIRYKVATDCSDSHVSNNVIENSIYVCMGVYREHMDGLLQCIITDKRVEEIVGE